MRAQSVNCICIGDMLKNQVVFLFCGKNKHVWMMPTSETGFNLSTISICIYKDLIKCMKCTTSTCFQLFILNVRTAIFWSNK